MKDKILLIVAVIVGALIFAAGFYVGDYYGSVMTELKAGA